MYRLALGLVVLVLAAGCRGTPPKTPAAPVVEEYPVPSP